MKMFITCLLCVFSIILSYGHLNAQCTNIISGKVVAHTNYKLSDIELVFELNNNVVLIATPNDDGDFVLPISPNSDFEVLSVAAIAKSGGVLFNVSTLDLVLIQKHIIGLAPLEDENKVIAADINEDQRISVRDLVELRQLILGVITNFSTNGSFKELTQNNFQFPIKVTNCIADKTFIELKIVQKGNVN